MIVSTGGEANYGVLQLGAAHGWADHILELAAARCGYSFLVREPDIEAVRLVDRAALESPSCVAGQQSDSLREP